MSFAFKVIIPRPLDAFYAEITDEDGFTVRHQIDALDEVGAYEEIDLIFDAHHVVGSAFGTLFHADGRVAGTAFCHRQAKVAS